MAYTTKTGGAYDYWLSYRSGPSSGTTSGDALVSDLQVGDYLPGARGLITAIGTNANPRSITLQRLGHTWSVSWPNTATVQIVR